MDKICQLHVSLVPVIGAVGEQKTKPTQASVRELRALGLTPDIVVCRSTLPLTTDTKRKISLFTHVRPENVVGVHDVSNIYRVYSFTSFSEVEMDREVKGGKVKLTFFLFLVIFILLTNKQVPHLLQQQGLPDLVLARLQLSNSKSSASKIGSDDVPVWLTEWHRVSISPTLPRSITYAIRSSQCAWTQCTRLLLGQYTSRWSESTPASRTPTLVS